MMLSETLPDMTTSVSPRQLAGTIVRDEIAAQGLKQTDAAKAMRMAPSTLARIMRGEPNVTDLSLRQVEKPLGLPRHLLTYIIESDVEKIGALDMDPDLRAHILGAIEDIKRGSRDDDGHSKRRRDA